MLRQIIQNIQRQEALKAAASISNTELEALSVDQLAQIVRSEREKNEQLQLELERASMRFSKSENSHNNSSTSPWKWILGAVGEKERVRESAIAVSTANNNRDDRFEQVNPMLFIPFAGGSTTTTNAVEGKGKVKGAAEARRASLAAIDL